jgi:hypothetical protein
MFKENIDSNVAPVGLGRKEQIALREAQIGVDERAGLEFKGAPVDAFGDFRGSRSIRKAAAAAGFERPARKSRSWAWKGSSSAMEARR